MPTRQWLTCGLLLGLGILAGCASWRGTGGSLWPIPPPVIAPQLDSQTADVTFCFAQKDKGDSVGPTKCFTISKAFVVTTRQEPTVLPEIVVSRKAWEAIVRYAEELRQGWCEARSTLAIANGQKPERIPLCQPRP